MTMHAPETYFTPAFIEVRRRELQKFLEEHHHPSPEKFSFYLMEHIVRWELRAWYAGAGNPDRS